MLCIQEVLYERVPAGRRVDLHRRIGEREEQAYGERAREIAAELPCTLTRRITTSAQYLWQAGEMPSGAVPMPNAINLPYQRAGANSRLSRHSRAHPTRTQNCKMRWAWLVMPARVYAVPEVETAFTRRESSANKWGTPRSSQSCGPEWILHYARGIAGLSAPREQLLALSQTTEEHVFLQMAHDQLGRRYSISESLLWPAPT